MTSATVKTSMGHQGDLTWKTDLALCFFTLFQMESVGSPCRASSSEHILFCDSLTDLLMCPA